jgi:CO/xanthine dehydrogenase FAD-binding subunit
LIPVLLDAVLTCVSPTGIRQLGARDFVLGALTTALEQDEMVTEVVLPFLPEGTGWTFEEFSRRSGDFAIVAAAATVSVVNSRAADVRLGVTGMGVVPQRATAQLVGNVWNDDLLRDAAPKKKAAMTKQVLQGHAHSAPPSSRPAATMAVTIPEYPVQRQI